MNGLSARERRLLVILGGVLVIMVGVFLLGRGGGSAEGVPDLVFPTPSFVVPSGARDPFGNS